MNSLLAQRRAVIQEDESARSLSCAVALSCGVGGVTAIGERT